jgi:hypothetical protein
LAKPALTAADCEGYDHAIADLEVVDFGPKLNHLAHVFVAENVAPLHGGLIPIKEMKVRATDRAGGYFDDSIARMLNLWIGDSVYPDVTFSMPAQRAHSLSP